MKIKKETIKFILAAIFILIVGFGFGKVEKAEAADADDIGNCTYKCSWYAFESVFGYKKEEIKSSECFEICKNPTKNECNEDLIAKSGGYFSARYCSFRNTHLLPGAAVKEAPTNKKNTSCSGSEWLSSPMNCPLLALLNFMVSMLQLAASLFTWIMDPENITSVIGNKAIYSAWVTVRDVLNISFVMFLLFSAFATVFQVEKYSYKKILLTLVIMALLVNFSFPISRFIIDISNVMMYYFASALGIDAGKTVIAFADVADLPTIIYNGGGGIGSYDTTYLLTAVIFVFIFTITVLIITVLFVIRTIALAILIIFSSLAFVGTAIPPLSSYASDWWNKLFKYAFFGPIMLFMLYVASKLMTEIAGPGKGSMKIIASGQTTDPDFIATLSFFLIPIIILWLGIGVAQSMSIAGASAVTGKAKGFMGWAGKTFSGAAFVGGAYKAYQSRRTEAGKDSWRNRLGTFIGSRQDQLRGVAPGRGGRDAQIRYERDLRQKVEDEAKRRDTANAATGDLQNLATTGNRFERAAAIQELANRGQATAAQLQEVGRNFGETSQVFSQLVAKVKAYDPIAAFSTAVNAAGQVTAFDQARVTEYLQSNQFDAKKLNANSLGNADFMELAFQEQAISNTDLEDLRKKSIGHESNIRQSLGNVAGGFSNLADTPDPDEAGISNADRTMRLQLRQQQRINRNVQMAHFAQTGNFHNSLAGDDLDDPVQTAARAQIISRLDKDTAKRMNVDALRYHYQEMADNITPNRYKNIVLGIENNEVQRDLNTRMQHPSRATGTPTAQNINRLASRDHDLMHIHN